MQLTNNYKLRKPDGTDVVNIDDFNSNADIIDNALKAHDTQLSDFVYQTAGGTGTALTVTIKGTLVNGYPITFIASANNGGAATTINGKKLYKPGTTTAPNLIAGKAYTVWYNQAGDCFFIKASAEGDAIAVNVLAGKKFSNDNDIGLVGTLDLSNLVSGNIKSGVSINGVSGKASVVDTSDANASAGQILNGETAYINGNKVTGNMPNNYGAWQYSGVPMVGTHRLHMYPPKGYYDPAGGTGIYYDDSGFDPANIVSGKSIFGLGGSAELRKRVAGTITTPSYNQNGQNVTVNVGFRPKMVYVALMGQSTSNGSFPVNNNGVLGVEYNNNWYTNTLTSNSNWISNARVYPTDTGFYVTGVNYSCVRTVDISYICV